MFPNDYGILRRPPCLQSHARCWFQVDLFMARLTQISPKNHTPSPVETGETSQLWRDSSKATMFPNDYGILRRPPCLQSHARCWFQVDLFMARLTQISPKNHTPSRVEPGKHRSFEESPDSSKAAIFPGFNRTSGDVVGSLVKVPKGEVGPMVKDFYHKKNVQVLMCRIFFDSPFLLVSSFFLWATQKKPCKNY